MIIGITALARAGKDTFADYLASKYGFKKLNMSDVLKEELIRQGKEPNKLNMSLLGDEWRTKFGKDVVIKRTLERAHDFKNVVISGLRSPEEAEYLKIAATSFYLVAIIANQEVRYERRTKLDPQRKIEFFARDQIDIENKGLGEVMAIADYRMENEEDMEKFFNRIEEVMGKIREEEKKKEKLPQGLVDEEDVMYT